MADPQATPDRLQIQCPACKGNGHLLVVEFDGSTSRLDDPCYRCEGTGQIDAEKAGRR